MARILSYKAKVSMSLVTIDQKEYPIPPAYIDTIATDIKYKVTNIKTGKKFIMPIVYAILNVDEPLYNIFIDNVTDGVINLRIENYDAENELSLNNTVIDDQFIYFIPSKYNYSKDIKDPNINPEDYEEHIVLGMLKATMIYANKQSFNLSYVAGSEELDINGIAVSFDEEEILDTEHLLEIMLENITGQELYMDELEVNKEYTDGLLIPPQGTVAEAIDYIFNLNPFYETDYLFFMDFKKTYLINTSGSAREVSKNTIMVNIEEINSRSALYTGFSKDLDNGAYIIYVNESDANVFINTTTDKVYNQTVSTYTDQVTTLDSNITVLKKETSNRQEFTKANEMCAEIRKQVLDNTAVTINISKMNMDSSLITPDKCYVVNYSKYSAYNGVYLLIYKKEIIKRDDNTFTTTTIFGLEKIADTKHAVNTVTA